MSDGPYPSADAIWGGIPTVIPDVPSASIFLALFLASAVTSMLTYRLNHRTKHNFSITLWLFVFAWTRILASTLRIIWSTRSAGEGVRLEMASRTVFNIGIIIIYLVNILLAKRVLRGKRPKLGWNRILAGTVVSYETLNESAFRIANNCIRAAVILLLLQSLVPFILLALAFLTPGSQETEVGFGQDTLARIACLLLVTSTLATTVAGFRCGIRWMPARPVDDSAWYHERAAFYVFGFTFEALVLSIFLAGRIDRMFRVPDGSG
ncbi:hypothetical protein B0A48_00134 [Cryoendolithus antarcticus]|uniref:Uncharacterized protein n=1 Tax=Cryoendolithus antarcticus TaxID=1507870 RepID=A0A1V8TU88_9PEZI|nr:hypothetical protein B0A48_00134 [Cryoendolithus antarcticus]